MKRFNYKSILKDWVPPIIAKAGVKLFSLDPSERKTYASYAEALKDTDNPEGYELDNIVKLEYLRTRGIKEQLEGSSHVKTESVDLKGLVSLSAFISKKSITVIDLGGGCGRHYFYKRKLLSPDIELKWYVVETTAMCEYGKQLANDELQFRDNLMDTIKEAGQVDMIYASGVLQCVDKPWEFLELITTCGADYIFFHRLALSLKDDVTVIHRYSLSWNGTYQLPEGVDDREVAYPFTFIRKDAFMEKLTKRYSIVMEFDESSGVFPVKGEEIVGMGLLCKRK
jgi:putative methyltransferase (TIGR04325 family)